MDDERRLPAPETLVRLGLVAFVLLWIFGPYSLRSVIPVWLVFVVALGLEVTFLVEALRDRRSPAPDRGPQRVDRARYGYEAETDELVLLRRGDEEVWIPYSGESQEELEELADELEPLDHEPAYVPREVSAFRRSVFWLGVLALLAVVVWLVEARTGWDSVARDSRVAAEERFSAEASRIAGKPVDVRCDESRDYVGAVQHAEGVAFVGGDRAYLTPERCHDLYRLAFEDELTFSQTARALAVLAHEAWHLRGVRDEGTTECYALQSGVALGRRLGLSGETARDMMSQQLAENALRGAGSVEYRVPAVCRDGARLDLDPVSTRFP